MPEVSKAGVQGTIAGGRGGSRYAWFAHTQYEEGGEEGSG
jgi:hypothetical protein